jgi:hypothetical protein
MEIIDELEPVKRGIYAGAVGYLGFNGDMDLAIAIRTAIVKDGQLHVQAGAGIVADSDPASEWQETQNKARAVLRAAELAEHGLDTRQRPDRGYDYPGYACHLIHSRCAPGLQLAVFSWRKNAIRREVDPQ